MATIATGRQSQTNTTTVTARMTKQMVESLTAIWTPFSVAEIEPGAVRAVDGDRVGAAFHGGEPYVSTNAAADPNAHNALSPSSRPEQAR